MRATTDPAGATRRRGSLRKLPLQRASATILTLHESDSVEHFSVKLLTTSRSKAHKYQEPPDTTNANSKLESNSMNALLNP
jgi:hypothetical protein